MGTLTLSAGLLGSSILLAGCSHHSTDPVPGTATTANIDAPPSNLKANVFQGISLPGADQGPRNNSGAVVSGFDRSPVGAALAAINTTVRISVATDSEWAPIGQRMLASGPGRDAWAIARSQISITDPITANAPRIAGYRVATYTADRAEIAIFTIQSDQSLTRNAAIVIWQLGDWKLLLPSQLQTSPVQTVTALPSNLIPLPLP
ncbi:hypothetical protein KHQ06_24455 [Nocardia tengchongensis]|uniref:DUF8175 domain-containing protein n=1 Tax=Nocardia tengchongensis TaxID=2055889 RepID=A0ABX8CLX8_9NOCA|nr:hypothetical protein [Nocardia tengchongensis]QVI19515.1 hypothetical protein KHQ06_24455 [Nocardia tengchongensis]